MVYFRTVISEVAKKLGQSARVQDRVGRFNQFSYNQPSPVPSPPKASLFSTPSAPYDAITETASPHLWYFCTVEGEEVGRVTREWGEGEGVAKRGKGK